MEGEPVSTVLSPIEIAMLLRALNVLEDLTEEEDGIRGRAAYKLGGMMAEFMLGRVK